MGESRIPDSVPVFVEDADVSIASAALLKCRFGIANPGALLFSVMPLFWCVEAISAFQHQRLLLILLAAPSIVVAIWAPLADKRPRIFHPSRLVFSDKGLIAREVSSFVSIMPGQRSYTWRWIRSIDDAGDLFLICPYFREPIIVPKRSFADGGIAARAFFTAHGVAGRTLLTCGSAMISA